MRWYGEGLLFAGGAEEFPYGDQLERDFDCLWGWKFNEAGEEIDP